ncbi:hypothetical protein O181_079077 [Austropuccinia psidii MF-1]|uniref:DUF4939 domain-containing protein n=1 Tax=Austropuccinia psidii MF-1 TaxID=1389203 RepID=A0A9Q3FJ01_9BASI|nr:hypothetical protein [Austropuccinia psidii MF-1]
MPVQHSPPAKITRSHRHKAFLTPKERASLDCTPSVHQLSANLDRVTPMEGAETSRRGGTRSRSAEDEDHEGDKPEETEVEAPEASGGPNLAPSNQPLVSQSEPNFLKRMEQMTRFIGQLTKAVAPRDNSRAPEFKTPLMNSTDSFDGTKAHKLRGFIQYCQLILHNDPASFFSERKKFLYLTSFLTGRAGKWIEPYLSNIFNEYPSYLLNNR